MRHYVAERFDVDVVRRCNGDDSVLGHKEIGTKRRPFRGRELVRPRGTVVMKSTFHGEARLATWPIVVDEVTIVGSRCGPFRRAIEMLASGAIQVTPLISREAPLEDYAAAVAHARSTLKVLLRM